MLLICVSLSGIKVVVGDVDEKLTARMGEDFGKVISYSWVEVGNVNLVKLEKYDKVKYDLVDLSEVDERDKLEVAIDSATGYTYDAIQSDPNMLFELGGNCQAVSLYLYETFKQNNIPTGLMLDEGIDHMCVWAEVDGQRYKVDLVKNIVEVIG